MIKRKKYLNTIEKYINKPVIKVITGMRRVGKSYFVKQIINSIKAQQEFDRKAAKKMEDIFIDFGGWYNTDIAIVPIEEALKNNPELWVNLKMKPAEEVQGLFPEYYKEWVRLVGGIKNVFLRELTRDKKLA